MTLKEAISILNKIGYGYTDRWKETAEGNIEAEGMRLSGPQAIAEAEYWAAFTVKIKSEKKECGVSFSTDETNTGVPELLDRIDALERKEKAAVNEIQRLLLSRSEAIAERDSARARLERVETALRDAIGYLAEVGPHHLDSGMEDSGCDRVMTGLVAALGVSDAKV